MNLAQITAELIDLPSSEYGTVLSAMHRLQTLPEEYRDDYLTSLQHQCPDRADLLQKIHDAQKQYGTLQAENKWWAGIFSDSYMGMVTAVRQVRAFAKGRQDGLEEFLQLPGFQEDDGSH